MAPAESTTIAAAPLVEAPSVSSYAGDYPGEPGFVPLTGGERANLYFKGYLGAPSTYVLALFEGGGSQIAGTPDGWPRTFNGYERRAATSLALNVTETAVRSAGDAAMRLDPRYFPCRCGGVLHRSWYALKMTALAYDNNGHVHLDLPRFAADYGGSMFVTTWYPASYSPLTQGIKLGHVQVGFDLGFNLYREFSPEMKRVLHVFHRP